MAHSFLIFDFGSNEEAAQQARHKVEGWKQGFRLGNKLMVKFDRGEEEASEKAGTSGEAKKNGVVMMVRLDFSDHEKLSHQRWLDRIPAEAPFHEAKPKILRQGDPDFANTAERFDALD